MKKTALFILLVVFLAACSQYTCPTYAKKESGNTVQRF